MCTWIHTYTHTGITFKYASDNQEEVDYMLQYLMTHTGGLTFNFESGVVSIYYNEHKS